MLKTSKKIWLTCAALITTGGEKQTLSAAMTCTKQAAACAMEPCRADWLERKIKDNFGIGLS